jgi:2-polyprenyl-3-methyl-5-hydroxy-6-metoxy-1,4-benzoquinol methylase
MALYDQIGKTYDETRQADPFILGRLALHLNPAGTASDAPYLDIGCGTGNYTSALFRLGLKMTGLDASVIMFWVAEKPSR